MPSASLRVSSRQTTLAPPEASICRPVTTENHPRVQPRWRRHIFRFAETSKCRDSSNMLGDSWIATGRSPRSSPSATSTLSRRCRIEIAVELGLQEQGPCDLQSRLS